VDYKEMLYRCGPLISRALYQFGLNRCGDEISEKIKNQHHQDRDFEYAIKNFVEITKIRDVTSKDTGSLNAIRGQITNTTEVRPCLVDACFMCQECFTKQHGVTQQFRFTTPAVFVFFFFLFLNLTSFFFKVVRILHVITKNDGN
jgi:DNA replication licensing factor MCM6